MDVRLEKMHLPFAINDAHMKYNNFSKIYYKCTSQIIFPKKLVPSIHVQKQPPEVFFKKSCF